VSNGVPLSIALGDYDIHRALVDGTVVPQGTRPNVLLYPSPERHARMLKHLEFDVCELSLGSFLMVHDRGDMPVVAIPVFPHRRFRHGYAFVDRLAGITTPRDLEGRRVGIRTWQTTAGIWVRGILQDDHGVDLKSIEWVRQDAEDLPLAAPDAFRFRDVDPGDSVTAMLERGDLAGLVYPETPSAFGAPGARTVRLFPDPKAAELEWAARTGLFPLMHTVVVRRELVEAHPWLPLNLVTAFRAAKDAAFAKMRDPRRISLAWFAEALDEQRQALGPDPWAVGLEPARSGLELLIRWSHEQGLISHRPAVETLFAPSTLDEPPAYV
jgi:4,5-dihydroxyphthalate decarboxylase